MGPRRRLVESSPMNLTPEAVNAFVQTEYPTAAAQYRCESLGERQAVARWPLDVAQNRPGGLISGPVQFGVADVAFWFATFTILGLKPMAVTSELSIRFLRAAQGGDLMARAEILRHGRSGLVGDVQLWIDGAPDRLVAVARGTYVDASPS